MSRYVKVKFLSSKDDQAAGGYFYKDTQSRSLKKWDTVLVPTRYGLTLAVVIETYSNDEKVQVAYRAYGTFGLHDIKTVSEKIRSKVVDEELKLQKADDIRKKLDTVMKAVDESQKYKMYAEISPEVAELLKELESLKA